MKRTTLVYHKIFVLLISRKMLGILTEESCLYGTFKVNPDEIEHAILFLIEKGYVAKVTAQKVTYYELTEKGLDEGSIHMAKLFAKAVVFLQ
jgi:hypothetical protein